MEKEMFECFMNEARSKVHNNAVIEFCVTRKEYPTFYGGDIDLDIHEEREREWFRITLLHLQILHDHNELYVRKGGELINYEGIKEFVKRGGRAILKSPCGVMYHPEIVVHAPWEPIAEEFQENKENSWAVNDHGLCEFTKVIN